MTDLCLRSIVRAIGYCLHTEVDNLKIGRYIVPLFSKSAVLYVYSSTALGDVHLRDQCKPSYAVVMLQAQLSIFTDRSKDDSNKR